jgi:hypothetical protein
MAVPKEAQLIEDMEHSVVLFYSVSGAFRAEKLLQKEGIVTKLIPVPRHLSSDCGVSLRFEGLEEARVRVILEKGQVEIQGVYPI